VSGVKRYDVADNGLVYERTGGRWVPHADYERDTAALLKALDDAIELAEEGIGYTDGYFVEKWRMKERLEECKARALLSKGGE
jgi:hypothetical protein